MDVMHDCDRLHSGSAHRRNVSDPSTCTCGYLWAYDRCPEHGRSRRRRPIVRAADLSLGPRAWVNQMPARTLAHCGLCGAEDILNAGRGMCRDCRRAGVAGQYA